jgi:hypothetical protein
MRGGRTSPYFRDLSKQTGISGRALRAASDRQRRNVAPTLTAGYADLTTQLALLDRIAGGHYGDVMTAEDVDAAEGASNLYSEIRAALRNRGVALIVRHGAFPADDSACAVCNHQCDDDCRSNGCAMRFAEHTCGKEEECHENSD